MNPPERSALQADWMRLLSALGCPAAAGARAFADLRGRYSESHRSYHTLDHIRHVLETVRSLGASDQPALVLAVWFHDAIHDPRPADNEEKSAAHARAVLQPLGVPDAVLKEVERLILLTKTHRAAPDDRAGQVLLDADLAILGAAEADYDAYARAIRREYAWVDEETFRAGRRSVLEGFLRRPRIYATPEMFLRAESRARENLRREIVSLREHGGCAGSSPPPDGS